ncbi:ABC transporter ATP-binding protein uup-1, partial [Aureobasidium melanogenum]
MVVTRKAVLNVTTQQSRFHKLKQESASTEITVKDLSITIGNHEVLSHAQLQLHPGRHYVLVGRNGIGKSTLLRAMAEGLVLPDSIQMLLLGQVQEDEDHGSSAPVSSDETVLEHVLRSDKQRERRINEASRLSTAMDNVDDPTAMLKVYQEELTAALKRLDQLDVSSDVGVEEAMTVKEETQSAIDMLTDTQASLLAVQLPHVAFKLDMLTRSRWTPWVQKPKHDPYYSE